jgi:hypothetical protein
MPNHTVPYGTVLSVGAFPGTSCLDTIMLSLWDEKVDQCRISHSREIKETPAKSISTTNGRFSNFDDSLASDWNREPRETGLTFF